MKEGGERIKEQRLAILLTHWKNSIYLKSVDGSFPCHPISFHCSDIKPRSSSSGQAAIHNALRASYRNAEKEDSVLLPTSNLFTLISNVYNHFENVKGNLQLKNHLMRKVRTIIGNINPVLQPLQAFLLLKGKFFNHSIKILVHYRTEKRYLMTMSNNFNSSRAT